MKKTIISIFSVILGVLNAYSQIAIMTDNPAGNSVLHVDAAANNSSGGANVHLDDVAVDKNGNVGIGTIAPQTKLHIVTGGTSTTPNPQLKIEGSNGGVNKVLMSDNNGVGQWSGYVPGFQIGTLGAGVSAATTAIAGSMVKTNMSISLDPGQWMVFFTISMTSNTITPPGNDKNYRFWIQVTLGDNSNQQTPDMISKNQFSNTGFIAKRSVVNGWVAIDNKTATAKTYSIYVGGISFAQPGLNLQAMGDKNDGYSTMYAFRINMLN